MLGQVKLLPDQMVSDEVKQTEDWQKQNMDAFENIIMFENRQLRPTLYNKFNNYNLKRNVINQADFERILDPHGLGLNSFPARLEHMGFGNAKIDLLVGEHMNRRFDWRVTLSNNDENGISLKEQRMYERIKEELTEMLQASSLDEKEAQVRLQKLSDYMNYQWQDVAESGGQKILKYYYKQQDLDTIFNRAFEDALVAGEQIIFTEALNKELFIRKGDPTKIFTIMSAESIDESGLEALVEVTYQTVSNVLDNFYPYLNTHDIAKLQAFKGISPFGGTSGWNYPTYGPLGEIAIPDDSLTATGIFPVSELERTLFATNIDVNGNMRIVHCLWKSKRQVKLLKYIDENGQEVEKYVHHKYKPNKLLGEEIVKEMWVNEWWRGYKIGYDIYTKIEPVPFLSTTFENISRQEPPVTIQIHNTNTSKAQSLMDICKPFDYMLDVLFFKKKHLTSLMLPDMLVFPTSMMPDGMKLEEFINYIQTSATVPLDPTAEIDSGPSAGKAAGQINNTVGAQIISAAQNGPLSVVSELINTTLAAMDSVTGISQQRQGAIQNRELVGNVERSVTQSSMITERWFRLNDKFKLRVLRKVLNIAVQQFKENPKKFQYVLDDLSTLALTDDELTGVLLSEFDLHVTNSSNDAVIMQKIEGLFQVAMQNGTAKLSDVLEIYQNESIANATAKLKLKEKERAEQEQALQQQQQEIERELELQRQEIEDRKVRLEAAKLELERYKIDTDRQTKLEVAQLQAMSFDTEKDYNNNNQPDYLELRKLELEKERIELDKQSEITRVALEQFKENNKLKIAEKKLEVDKIKAKKQNGRK